MTVRQVLAEKGGDVVTIGPDKTLAEAAAMLAKRKIGAVVVTREGADVAGILSERDIIRALADKGQQSLTDHVSAHMTSEVVTCPPEADMDHLMRAMTRGKFRHVPVVEAGRLVGIVSIGDVVKRRLAEVEAEHEALREYIATA
ncbi:MAG: CBS domain-containing protein [Salinarimonadaceae bacterium]|nr:MAG: CBS domain-containing protein [Salinarimonadaceae bacterium]